MRKVNGRKLNFLSADVIPDIKFCPVADREYSYIFSFMDFSVEDTP
jgi:hypothetical protein